MAYRSQKPFLRTIAHSPNYSGRIPLFREREAELADKHQKARIRYAAHYGFTSSQIPQEQIDDHLAQQAVREQIVVDAYNRRS